MGLSKVYHTYLSSASPLRHLRYFGYPVAASDERLAAVSVSAVPVLAASDHLIGRAHPIGLTGLVVVYASAGERRQAASLLVSVGMPVVYRQGCNRLFVYGRLSAVVSAHSLHSISLFTSFFSQCLTSKISPSVRFSLQCA